MVILLSIFISYSPLKSFTLKQVATGSMVPKLPVGSIVIVTRANPNSIVKGDIINFNNQFDSSLNVTHRVDEVVVSDKGVLYKTKGDANQSADADLVPAYQVKGKVFLVLPFLGHLYKFSRQPLGFGLLIILPALYIIISELIFIKKVIEEEAIKKHELTKKSKTEITMISLLFVFGLTLSSLKIASTSAYFSSGNDLSSIFSTGNWKDQEGNQDDDHDDDHEDDENCDNHKDYKERKTDHPKETCKEHKDDNHNGDDDHKHPKIKTKISSDRHHYSFYLSDIEDFYDCKYEATYETDMATKGFGGHVALNRQSVFSKENILLGSRSSEAGESYDGKVKNLKISVVLTRPDGTTEKIEYLDD